MKIVPEKKSERFVDEATLRSAIRSRQSYLKKEHCQEKKNRIQFKYVEFDTFGKEMSEIFHYSCTPYRDHAEAFDLCCDGIEFGSMCKEDRLNLVTGLCLRYKYEKNSTDKLLVLKALSHLLEGTFIKDRKENASKTYIVENIKVMFENNLFETIVQLLFDNINDLHNLYATKSDTTDSKLIQIPLNNVVANPTSNLSLCSTDEHTLRLNEIKENLGLYTSMLCMMLVGVIGGKSGHLKLSLRSYLLKEFSDGRIFVQFLLDCLVFFCNQSVCEIPIKRIIILIRLSLLVMLGTCLDADGNHDRYRQNVGLGMRQHRLNMPKRTEDSTKSTTSNQHSKLRLDDFVEYMSTVYMNHFGIDLSEYLENNDKCAVFDVYTKNLPPILYSSIEMDKKRVFVPLSVIQIKEEMLREKLPLTHKKLEFDFLKPTELLYQKLVPSLSKYVVAILKLFLSSIPHKTTASELPIYSELRFRSSSSGGGSGSSAPKDDHNVTASSVLYTMKKSVDRGRHQEILSKSLSTILLLLLKHFKSNNFYQFETLCYHMTCANFIQLACKFMGLGFQELVINRTSLDDYDFPWSLQEESLETTDKEIAKVKINTKGSFSYKTTFERKNNWRILQTLTNVLRIVQKMTKFKPTRIKMLVYYKTSLSLRKIIKLKCSILSYFSLKILKTQVPFLGKIWCKGNWKIFTLIYFLTHMCIHEDWVNSNNKNILGQDIKEVATLGIKNPSERQLKLTLDSYNQQYLNPTSETVLLGELFGDSVLTADTDPIDDPDFDDYLQNDFPAVAMDWVRDNVIDHPNDWNLYRKFMDYDNYI